MIRRGGKKLFLILFFICIMTFPADALGVGTTGANYLKIDAGARSAALGSAYVGLADDLNALYWNPAGIASIPYVSIDTMQINWFADITQQQIAANYPLGNFGVIGGYYSSLTTPYDSVTKYNDHGNYTATGESFNNEVKVINLTYAKELTSKLSVGVGLKQIEERLYDVKSTGTALDAGLYYKSFFLQNMSAGLVLQNFSLSPLRKDEPLPQTIVCGLAYDFHIFTAQRLTLLSDVSFPLDNAPFFGVGVEYAMNKYLSFRMGYKDKVGLTLGGGLTFGNLNLNYAYVPYGDLGNTYRISLGYCFDNTKTIFEKAEENSQHKEEQVMTNEDIFNTTETESKSEITENVFEKETTKDAVKEAETTINHEIESEEQVTDDAAAVDSTKTNTVEITDTAVHDDLFEE